ncbi:hypothetical protein GX888_01960 [Candidatus Dojkabacteria bacterium]|uniref:Uncharacterized protein n=1 Tax=Candidatus Dojkabacteria bacterium TaxID=2099670 RepID=A0A847VDB5_9BACT|nr:hypothetical protein [Candidatus Dojkabacteria bacterium]
MKIDVTYNFQAETEPLDADRYSLSLQEYHRILWSKPLPNGKMFELSKIVNNQLYHKSDLGEFYLSSDRAIPTFSKWKKLEHIIPQIPKDRISNFINLAETIGGIIIWPSNRIGEFQTINGARGFNSKISDRLDLTIECIRRYYLNQESPLYETFKRYNSFFRLFEDFKGYIDFFLFQDAVTSDYSSVRIATPFDNFESVPVPTTVDEYMLYMNDTMEFVQARNKRIARFGS